MINIEHEKVLDKPPLNKSIKNKLSKDELMKKRRKKCISSNRSNNNSDKSECADCSDHDDIFKSELSDFGLKTIFQNISNNNFNDSDDNNNNNSRSFDDLCCMINDLEKNLSEGKQVDVQTGYLPKETNFIISQINEKNDGSTYEDIMNFLGNLDKEFSIPNFDDKNTCDNDIKLPVSKNQTNIIEYNKIKDDLSTALLKLEDREATLKILKEELKTERRIACDKLEELKRDHLKKFQTEKIKYENVIKRHQKFIEQLIEEKKKLTDKCDELANRIKDMEVKQQREIKLAVERHAIEVKRAKELCLASEKIRRERWLEVKTSKIKEMTVKGLEPELRNMIEQHQKEIVEIRSAHMKELQDVELRAIRRSNQQLEQLRLELTASHDKVLSNEKDAIRLRYQEKFDEQEILIQEQQRKFFDDLQQEKKKLHDEQMRKDCERDLFIKKLENEFNEKVINLKKEFELEKKQLKDELITEKDTFVDNYKKQQILKLEKMENKIRDDCNRERDHQIELIISKLEKEMRNNEDNLIKTCDNKLKCLKEKYEIDLQMSHDNDKINKEKLIKMQEKIDKLEIKLQSTQNKLDQCYIDLNESKHLVNKLTRERDYAKKLAREEIDSEKKQLQVVIDTMKNEIKQLNLDKDTHMSQLYSRIKLIITQKDMTIKNIAKEANEVKTKCEHLERLLDQQRKDYVLK